MMKSPKGNFTLAYVDLGCWGWAIVKGFRNNQEFDEIVMMFDPEFIPNKEVVTKVLAALDTKP